MINSLFNISHTTEQSQDSGYESNPEYETKENPRRLTRSDSLKSLPDGNTIQDIKKRKLKSHEFHENHFHAQVEIEEKNIIYIFKGIDIITNKTEKKDELTYDLQKKESAFTTQKQKNDFSETKKYIDDVFLEYKKYTKLNPDALEKNPIIKNIFKKLYELKTEINEIEKTEGNKCDKKIELYEKYGEVQATIDELKSYISATNNKIEKQTKLKSND